MTTPIDIASIPAQVRSEGPKAQALYSTALQFEQLLVQQLAQGLTDATQSQDSSDSEDGSDDGSSTSPSDTTTGPYQDMLPNALAQGVTSGGGTGLAIDLYRSMGGLESKPTAATPTP